MSYSRNLQERDVAATFKFKSSVWAGRFFFLLKDAVHEENGKVSLGEMEIVQLQV